MHDRHRQSNTRVAFDIINEPRCSYSRQVILHIDSDRIRPRKWIHGFKRHLTFLNFTQGQNEVKLIIDQLDELGKDEMLRSYPYITAYIFFSGNKILCCTGKLLSNFAKY